MIHPAREMPFDKLHYALQYEVQEGGVYKHIGEDGLELYCYSEDTVYERMWNEITLIARGLILCPKNKKVVATPFPKFFNVGEPDTTIPDLPFEIFDKLDGSLIIIFYYNDKWRCSTKGSLTSDQAKWAQNYLQKHEITLIPGKTYLAEAIYPENRIVVNYKNRTALDLIAIYNEDGTEVPYDEFPTWSYGEIVKRHSYSSIADLLEKARSLGSDEEGWVLRFQNGMRLKIKGSEYCRIHRLISNLTPLAIWRSLRDNEDVEIVRRQLPEEFLQDFDLILGILEKQLAAFITEIELANTETQHLSDKELGLRLENFAPHIRRFIFPQRKGKLLSVRRRHGLFEVIRPNRNVLEGYQPSTSMVRVQENMKE